MEIFWNIIDENRFVVSVLIAQTLFLFLSSKRNKYFLLKSILGFVALIGISASFVFIRPFLPPPDTSITHAIIVTWYVFMVTLTTLYNKLCFKNTWWETIFRSYCGYIIQQVAYIICFGLVFRYYSEIRNSVALRLMIPLVIYGVIYTAMYFIFARSLNKVKDIHALDKKMLMLSSILFLNIVLFNLFMQGFLWRTHLQYAFRAVFIVFMGCVLATFVQYALYKMKNLNKEVVALKDFLHEKQKQYKIAKENISIINQKCHDLKYQIQAFKMLSIEERAHTINELEKAVMIYDSVVKTGNEVVNTILTEKTLYCEQEKIRLTCMVDSSCLDFIDTVDMYVILGNALDNAIECVSQYSDIQKRVIGLNIHNKKGFLSIRIENFFEGQLEFEEGLSVTTKKDKKRHGFGLKSIKMLTEKYSGMFSVALNDKTYGLQLLIPLP